MSFKKHNLGCVDNISKQFKEFVTDADTDHDSLLVVHIENTPKGIQDVPVRVMFRGCHCNMNLIIAQLMNDPDLARGILDGIVLHAKWTEEKEKNAFNSSKN